MNPDQHKKFVLVIVSSLMLFSSFIFGQHHPGEDCFNCHTSFKVAGTVFTDSNAVFIQPGAGFYLTKPDGNKIILDNSKQCDIKIGRK